MTTEYSKQRRLLHSLISTLSSLEANPPRTSSEPFPKLKRFPNPTVGPSPSGSTPPFPLSRPNNNQPRTLNVLSRQTTRQAWSRPSQERSQRSRQAQRSGEQVACKGQSCESGYREGEGVQGWEGYGGGAQEEGEASWVQGAFISRARASGTDA